MFLPGKPVSSTSYKWPVMNRPKHDSKKKINRYGCQVCSVICRTPQSKLIDYLEFIYIHSGLKKHLTPVRGLPMLES